MTGRSNGRQPASLNEAANSARGWVYVISNKAMPGYSKIGYSMKDPDLRAIELGNTGSPHPYQVEFDILVSAPRALERSMHRLLSHKNAGKEWFELAPFDAAEAILDFLEAEDPAQHEVYCTRNKTAQPEIYNKKEANNTISTKIYDNSLAMEMNRLAAERAKRARDRQSRHDLGIKSQILASIGENPPHDYGDTE